MLSFKECKRILNKNRKEQLTDRQIKEVSELVYLLATVSVGDLKRKGGKK